MLHLGGWVRSAYVVVRCMAGDACRMLCIYVILADHLEHCLCMDKLVKVQRVLMVFVEFCSSAGVICLFVQWMHASNGDIIDVLQVGFIG